MSIIVRLTKNIYLLVSKYGIFPHFCVVDMIIYKMFEKVSLKPKFKSYFIVVSFEGGDSETMAFIFAYMATFQLYW